MLVSSKTQYTQFRGIYDPFINPLMNARVNQTRQTEVQTAPAAEEKDPAKKAKAWIIATITGGTAFSILGVGLFISYLTRRKSGAIADLPLKMRRKLTLSIQKFEEKTLKTDFDKYLIKAQKIINTGLEGIINTLGNFDQASKSFIDERLMGRKQAGDPIGKLNIVQKIAIGAKNFFMKKADSAAILNYEHSVKTFGKMDKSVDKLVSCFNINDTIQELEQHKGLSEFIDNFAWPGKSVKDLLSAIKNDKESKDIYKLLSEKAASFDISDLEKRMANTKFSGLLEKLKTNEAFRSEFKEEMLLRFVVAKHSLKRANTKVHTLSDEFKVKRAPSVEEDLKEFVEQYRELQRGIIPKALNKEELAKTKGVYSYLTQNYNSEALWKEIHKGKADLLDNSEHVVRNINTNCDRIKRLFNQSDSVLLNALESMEIDKETLKELKSRFRDLGNVVDNYRYASGAEKAGREDLKAEYIKKIDEMISLVSGKPDAENLKLLTKKLNSARNRLSDDSKGLVEETASALKYYWPENEAGEKENLLKELYKKEYFEAKDHITGFTDSFRKAIKFEFDEYEGRKRELALGVGIFELAGPGVATLFYANEMIKADSNEERVSKSLTTGLPIAGGLGFWVYANLVKCVNGPSSIFLSLATGVLCSKVGQFIDDNFYSKGKKWNQAEALNDLNKGMKVYKS